MARVKKSFRVFDGEGLPRSIELVGRDAWALGALIHAGPVGCTPITTPGPRWSGYVHKLRHRYGLNIVTIDEEHGGPYAGTHARYVLKTRVEFAEDPEEDRPDIRPDAEQRAAP
ncbi:hypothetical protein [Enhydrobacter sp.]|jgi:hypothetical protein|uniref:winged helix domain-containing protein n=1 Tax=Enhydrobacter sp. TaxID=1894999 RepID=UPI00261B3490|nr:hypothetical protein [Enhydrobacter sp.]WIM10060.1 MAG: hypothetical protein OJF58_001013 [Enhydrobacter sp.]